MRHAAIHHPSHRALAVNETVFHILIKNPLFCFIKGLGESAALIIHLFTGFFTE